ncbi:MAG: HEAT repeat domain-containing protein [Treponema sp.]|jgi:HEAT repeat protein|nr:HEAT repeat domain-containing protein [Treponema sp.]
MNKQIKPPALPFKVALCVCGFLIGGILWAQKEPGTGEAAGAMQQETAAREKPADVLGAGESTNGDTETAQTADGGTAGNQADRLTGPLELTRLNTIKYGTETEIAALIQTLKTEGAVYLDDELIELAGATHNQKILSGVFTFFGSREKSGLEQRAVRAITERDEEANETVIAAVDYLGAVKAAQAAAVLKELLDSEERHLMNAAFRALGRVGGPGGEESDGTAEYLIDYYTNRDPGDNNRRDMIMALGATGSARGVSFLSDIAVDSEERIPLRIAAIESLSKIGDPGGLDAVLSCVSANDPNVRAAAVAALGPFSGEAADRAVLEAFRDSYYRTRIAAAQASRQRKLQAAVPYLKFRAERDDVPNVKDEAIRALGAINNSEATTILESLFTERKNSDRVRLVSAGMLMQNEPAPFLDRLIIELDEAKKKNQTALYNGLLKIIGETKCENMEAICRRLLKSSGVIEKSYGLDIALNNDLPGLAEEIKVLALDRNESLARKARRVLEKIGESNN